MSILGSLSPAKGSVQAPKRVGRGRGSGLGQTAGKGHKGQLARTGGKVRRGFEGGQTPLIRRLPKFGFSNVDFGTDYGIINLSQLAKSGLTEVTPEILKAKGLVHKMPLKILGQGKIEKAIKVKAHKFSQSAEAAIKAAGGSVEVIK